MVLKKQPFQDVLIATRKSELALCQARETQNLLKKFYSNVELFPVVTTGDKLQKTALADLPGGGKGLFVKEIQEALLTQKAHVAVHSMKDLPVEQAAGLKLVSLLSRANSRDVLILSPRVMEETGLNDLNAAEKDKMSFSELKTRLQKSQIFCTETIGTTSSRRQMLLRKNIQKDLNLNILRGNVDTRLKKLRNNEFAAIILAEAGLTRLGLFGAKDMFPLSSAEFIPAPAQGAIGIEVADKDAVLIQNIVHMGCQKTALAVGLERLVLFLLGGDCHAAVGVSLIEDKLHIICSRNNIEKEAVLLISQKEKNELEKMQAHCQYVYCDFFVMLCQSTIAETIKTQLLALDFAKVLGDHCD